MNESKPNATILIVDDEPDVVTYLETLFEDRGYRTVSADNGITAMQLVEREQPDLISLDITMPEQSGIRFYRNLKERPEFSHIPVIIVTAVTGYGGDPAIFERFLKTRRQIPPPEHFISKPIDREELTNAVEKTLAQAKVVS